MHAGEFEPVRGVDDLYVHDTGMFDTDEYGAVYVYDTERPIVVDTGTGGKRETLFETIEEIGIGREDLEWILATHAHLDHAGGAGHLAERYPNAEVLVPEKGVRHLVDPEALVKGTKSAVGDQWEYYDDPAPVPEDRISGLTEGDQIDLGERELIVHEAPGHAPHHAVYHDPDADVVFAADAGGIYVPEVDEIVATSPPPQFDLNQCLDDMQTVDDLDPEYLCFGHFGPREYEPVLAGEAKRAYVEWVEAVRAKREELDDDDAVVEHFETTSREIDYWNPERARANASLNTRGVLSYLDYVDDEE